jgi:putative spermidine/putrescine transport system permease protein
MSVLLRNLFFCVVGLFLALPLVIVAGISVNQGQQLLFPPKGFSLNWYTAVFTEPEWRGALQNSVVIAICAAALSVSIALPLAYVMWSKGGAIAKSLFALGLAPFTLPPVISALGFLVFWINAGGYGQMYATIISHAIFLVTLPLVTLSLGFESIDRQLVEAARTMGATDRKLFSTVLLPLIRPYLISGFAFAFVLSLNEYIIAYMVSGFTVETLPIKIFNALRYGYTPIMASVSVIFVLVAVLVFSLIARFGDLPKLMGAWSGDS